MTNRATGNWRRLGRLAIAIGIGVGMLGPTAGATRAANVVGGAEIPLARCYNGYILVSPPIMAPAQVQSAPAGQAYSSGFSQRVAFRANLAQLIDGRWYTVRFGTWFTRVAGSAMDYGLYEPGSGGSWVTGAGQPLPAGLGYDRLASGPSHRAPVRYAIWYDLYWYPDEVHAEGRTWAWVGHQDNRGAPSGTGVVDQQAYSSCNYPGPNWLVGIS
jgi:hypothetical protein